MNSPPPIPRTVAELVLRRAVLLDAEAEAEAEAERQSGGYTLDHLRSAALETGIDPSFIDRAAEDLLHERGERNRWTLLGYGTLSGVVAAVAAAGLLAAGHPLGAALFMVLDLMLVAIVLCGLDDHVRRGMVHLQGLVSRAPANGDSSGRGDSRRRTEV